MGIVALLSGDVQEAAVCGGGITVRLKPTQPTPIVRLVACYGRYGQTLYGPRGRDVTPPSMLSFGGEWPRDGRVAGVRWQLPRPGTRAGDGALSCNVLLLLDREGGLRGGLSSEAWRGREEVWADITRSGASLRVHEKGVEGRSLPECGRLVNSPPGGSLVKGVKVRKIKGFGAGR